MSKKETLMKRLFAALLLLAGIAACQPTPEEPDTLPTLAVLPSATASETPSDTPTPTTTPSDTPIPTETVTPSPTLTETIAPTATDTPSPTLTRTPTRTPTPSPTPNAAAALRASATARILEAPTLATFTPAPAGVLARPTSTGTPQVIADVVITEQQMQEDINRILAGNANVQSVRVNFTPEGVRLALDARVDGVISSGAFLVRFEMSQAGFDNFVVVYAETPDLFQMNNDLPPSEGFVAVAYQDAVPALFNAFNDILNRRLGEGRHDLDNVTFTDDALLISLLVPIR